MDDQQFVVLVTSTFYHRNSYYTFIFELWSFLTQLILQCCVHPFCLYSPSHLKSTWTHTIHKWMFGILNAFVLVINHVWESHTVPGDWLSYFVSVLFCMVGLLLPFLCVSLLQGHHWAQTSVIYGCGVPGGLFADHTSPFSAAPTTLYFGTQDTPEIASIGEQQILGGDYHRARYLSLGALEKYREVAQDLCSRAELWYGVPALLVTKCDSCISNMTSDPVPFIGGLGSTEEMELSTWQGCTTH